MQSCDRAWSVWFIEGHMINNEVITLCQLISLTLTLAYIASRPCDHIMHYFVTGTAHYAEAIIIMTSYVASRVDQAPPHDGNHLPRLSSHQEFSAMHIPLETAPYPVGSHSAAPAQTALL